MNSAPNKSYRPIYLVEDDIDDQELLADALALKCPGIQLISFSSGRKFLETIKKVSHDDLPGLIILDYNIPEMNGAEILQVIGKEERFEQIVKIVWSTSNSDRFKHSSLEAGARDYIIKPSNLSGIHELAEVFLAYSRID